MLKYNNTHIFTGYLKQLLSSFNLPTCKIYTREFARHLANTGEEDLRVLKSFDTYTDLYESGNCIGSIKTETVRVGYLKDDGIFNYYGERRPKEEPTYSWQQASDVFYSTEKSIKGLTKTLVSTGTNYDTVTHKYLGDYLRFIRDYYNINLMSMYNCFSDELCYNINTNIIIPEPTKCCPLTKLPSPKDDCSHISEVDQCPLADEPATKYCPLIHQTKLILDSSDTGYKIYKIPVKLFADYTIALECSGSVEMFCGLYNSVLDTSGTLGEKIIQKTYKKITNTLFSQPFLYNKLNVSYWQKLDINELEDICWDITAREQDLYLFIKVPATCRSSIVVLEGDYREYNSSYYKAYRAAYCKKSTVNNTEEVTTQTIWSYNQNRAILNFSNNIDLNNYIFKPISKLQLLAFNTGESYPFADRLIEYLTGSAITSIDDIHDNIIRAQRVMSQNNNFFRIEGLWEEKMQNILYDYMMNYGLKMKTIATGADEADVKYFGKAVDPKTYDSDFKEEQILIDTREGYNRQLGRTNKSLLFDILGYVDKDTEKTYASYTKEADSQSKYAVKNTIQNVDIYNGLYDI